MTSKRKKLEIEQGPRLLNRERSWLKFNERVLEEAVNSENPLLERLKFLAIFESNLDEFYMVRVSGLIEQYENGILDASPDGLTPHEQIKLVSREAKPLRKQAAEAWSNVLEPELRQSSIYIRSFGELTKRQISDLKRYFQNEVFPLCTPLMMYPTAAFPFISNRSLNLVVELEDPTTEIRLARVKVPTVIPRAVRIPGKKTEFVLLEDLIAANLTSFFPGVKVIGSHLFRVIRDADIEIKELEAADLMTSVQDALKARRFGDPVLLEVQTTIPERIQQVLLSALQLEPVDLFQVPGLLGYDIFWELARLDKPQLRFPSFQPYLSDGFLNTRLLFDQINTGDVLLHHPYDSFKVVEEFVSAASKNNEVIGIKQTLYRVGKESPIVESLLDAAEEGKQVAAMVELKARFDESNNMEWARALERAGVHVTFGFYEMKTHCKLSLIVRREADGIKQYAHIGTGNYNPVTARIYTDIGLFTCDSAVTQDISELFNYLTGFSKQSHYRKLLVAPVNLREGVLDLIDEVIAGHKKNGKGRIVLKLNALVDPEAIEALYEANAAGVKIDLIVRGICCLRPGVAGLSENITVCSIVGRFLEHSRIYYFESGESRKVLIGSADLMRRNLDRRIETLVPVENSDHISSLKEILEICLKDNVQRWDLNSNGDYVRLKAAAGKAFNAQQYFMAHPLTKTSITPVAPTQMV